jgi:hypothetical protein
MVTRQPVMTLFSQKFADKAIKIFEDSFELEIHLQYKFINQGKTKRTSLAKCPFGNVRYFVAPEGIEPSS